MHNSHDDIIEQTLVFVSSRQQNETANYLASLSEFLGTILRIDYVLIDKYSQKSPDIAQTVAVYNNNKILPNINYSLQNTPCYNVINACLCTYSSNVQQLFPDDVMLQEMNVESYIGIPLWSSTGEPIGLIAVMHSQPIENTKKIESVLKIVAIKAAHELEKLLFTNELQQQNLKLKAQTQELLATNEALEIAKKKVEESEQRFHFALSNSPVVVFYQDVQLRYKWMYNPNPHLKIADVLEKTDMELLPYEEAVVLTNIKNNVINTQRKHQSIVTITINNTPYVYDLIAEPWTDTYGNIIGVSCVAIDITERMTTFENAEKNKEEANASRQKLQTIFDTLTEGVALNEIVFDQDNQMIDYRIIDVNKAFYTTADYQGTEVIGKTATALYGMTTEMISQFWVEHKNKNEAKYFEMLSPISNRWFFVSTSPFVNNRFVTVFFDITKLKHTEQELKIAKQKAEESDRLKTAFLHNISHEIRTPMNAICGFADLLNAPDITPEKRDSFIETIQQSSQKLLSIVTDILTISAIETHQEKPYYTHVCINHILTELLPDFKQKAYNSNLFLHLKKGLSDTESEVNTDRSKLIHILTNLLDNAIKFTSEGFVEFGYRLVSTNYEEAFLEFYVKDTGIGIEKSLHEKIFERFHQADSSLTRNYGGAGLGLPIAKGLVELLGGKIWIESQYGKGASFYFTIPYKPINKVETELLASKNAKKRQTILIAEDEDFNYLLIKEILNDMSLKIVHAQTGKEAVEACNTNNIDLVLMDIRMPDMDGYEAALKIKKQFPQLPIIAQSAYALDHEMRQYIGAFDYYLKKPINANELRQKVLEYI